MAFLRINDTNLDAAIQNFQNYNDGSMAFITKDGAQTIFNALKELKHLRSCGKKKKAEETKTERLVRKYKKKYKEYFGTPIYWIIKIISDDEIQFISLDNNSVYGTYTYAHIKAYIDSIRGYIKTKEIKNEQV